MASCGDKSSRRQQVMSTHVLSRTRSVPTLGSRQVLKEPALTHKFPPAWHVRSTPSLAAPAAQNWSYTKDVDDAKEKQLEAACKKLWVAVHGAEYDIRELVRNEIKEGGTNQAMLQRLNKSQGISKHPESCKSWGQNRLAQPRMGRCYPADSCCQNLLHGAGGSVLGHGSQHPGEG
eukprot:s1804_g7.t1